MFDVTSFINRKHWTIEDLANQLFKSGGRSRVGMWKSGGSSPRYAAILQLIDLGVTAEELFGKEYADKLMKNSLNAPPEFLEGLNGAKDPESALNAIVERKILEMKERGLIK